MVSVKIFNDRRIFFTTLFGNGDVKIETLVFLDYYCGWRYIKFKWVYFQILSERY